MNKEQIKNLVYTIIYLILGSSSFIASGMYFHAAFNGPASNHIFRACLFCCMGIFWLYMFGEKRKETVFVEEDDLFFGSKINEKPNSE